MTASKATKAAPAKVAASKSETKDGFVSAAEALDLDPAERPNKALTEGPEGAGDAAARAEHLTRTLAHAAGGGEESEAAARPLAEAMAERQINEVPSRAERETRDAK